MININEGIAFLQKRKVIFNEIQKFCREVKMWFKYVPIEKAAKKFYIKTGNVLDTPILSNKHKERYNINVFLDAVINKKISLYGYDVYSKKLREIPEELIKKVKDKGRLCLDKEEDGTHSLCAFPTALEALSDRARTLKNERTLYTNLCIKRKHMRTVIKQYGYLKKIS